MCDVYYVLAVNIVDIIMQYFAIWGELLQHNAWHRAMLKKKKVKPLISLVQNVLLVLWNSFPSSCPALLSLSPADMKLGLRELLSYQAFKTQVGQQGGQRRPKG